MQERIQLTRFAWLSVATAVLTILLKVTAYFLTGSVGLLSDALESGVNLVAAIIALVALTVAAQPPDDQHAFGHAKAEYFSSGVEGVLILMAAGTIGWTAVNRMLHPQPLEQVGMGLLVSIVAAALNGGVSQVLLRAGRRYHSVTLEADARHLMTDVWTSGGVVLGVGAVAITGWDWLDPLIAVAVALQIIWSGWQLVQGAVMGLMDSALPSEEQEIIQRVLAQFCDGQQVQFHALRTRQSAAQRFMSVHLQVPGVWTVQEAHNLAERVEGELRLKLNPMTITIHLEPVEDPVSWEDIPLVRAVGEEGEAKN